VVLHVFPVLIGAGTTAFPADVRLDLELVAERRFGDGVVGLEYRRARS
jgi:dihydrofolate reductase